MSAAQKFLPIKVELQLPTVDLAGARAITGRHENELKEMVLTGDLVWVWDISRAFAASTKTDEARDKRELRFLVRELRWLGTTATALANLTLDSVATLLYGPQKPFVLGRHWHRAWNCDSGHMINLVVDRTLETVAKTTYGRGRGKTPCITWPSAVQFLKTRRLS